MAPLHTVSELVTLCEEPAVTLKEAYPQVSIPVVSTCQFSVLDEARVMFTASLSEVVLSDESIDSVDSITLLSNTLRCVFWNSNVSCSDGVICLNSRPLA